MKRYVEGNEVKRLEGNTVIGNNEHGPVRFAHLTIPMAEAFKKGLGREVIHLPEGYVVEALTYEDDLLWCKECGEWTDALPCPDPECRNYHGPKCRCGCELALSDTSRAHRMGWSRAMSAGVD